MSKSGSPRHWIQGLTAALVLLFAFTHSVPATRAMHGMPEMDHVADLTCLEHCLQGQAAPNTAVQAPSQKPVSHKHLAVKPAAITPRPPTVRTFARTRQQRPREKHQHLTIQKRE